MPAYWGYVEDYLSFLYHYSGSIYSIGIILSRREFQHDTVNLFLDTIGGRFHISPLVLMPMAVLLILNLMKYPAVPSMAIGTVLAVLVAVFYQGCPMRRWWPDSITAMRNPPVWSWWISFIEGRNRA